MALTSSKVMYRQHFGPLMPGVHIAPYPYCLHCKWQVEKGREGYRLEPYCAPFDDAGPPRVCCNAPLEVGFFAWSCVVLFVRGGRGWLSACALPTPPN